MLLFSPHMIVFCCRRRSGKTHITWCSKRSRRSLLALLTTLCPRIRDHCLAQHWSGSQTIQHCSRLPVSSVRSTCASTRSNSSFFRLPFTRTTHPQCSHTTLNVCHDRLCLLQIKQTGFANMSTMCGLDGALFS